MSIYRTSVEHPVTTALVFLALAIMGVFSLVQLPVDNFPDIESNTIMVMSSYPGASAEDVETNLTKVLENSLNGVPNLKNLTSNSRENIAVLTLEFEYGTPIDEATNDVRDKLDMVSQALPDGASSAAGARRRKISRWTYPDLCGMLRTRKLRLLVRIKIRSKNSIF